MIYTAWWKKKKKSLQRVLTTGSYIQKKVDERKQENFARDVEKTFDKDSEGR